MWHVDDGHLHAWLDGALDHYPEEEARAVREHLSSCETCAARLEEARALRAETGAILAGSLDDPGPLPDLEELRAEAARRNRARQGPSRATRLAWAASVVLAMGAGWMAHEVAGPGGVTRPVPSAPGALQESPPLPGSGAGSEARAEGAGGARAVAREPREAQEAQEAQEERAGGEAARAARTDTQRAGREVAGEDRSSAGRAAADQATPVTPAEAERRTTADASSAVPSAAVPSTEGAAPPPDTQAAAVTEDARAFADPDALTGLAAPARLRDADAALPLGVPGLPVLSAVRTAAADGGTVVRVLQRLAPGDTLEVLHLLGGADPSALPVVVDGRTELTLPVEGGWVVLRALRSAQELRTLGAALLP